MRAAVSLLGIAATLAAGCGERRAVERPNVLLVVIDTLRAEHCSAFGYERRTTPVLEDLAQRGSAFDGAWAQGSWTLPSMVSLLTGRSVVENRRTVPDAATTLAERFRAAGYDTAAVVANPLLIASAGFAQGFAHYSVARPKVDAKDMPAEAVVLEARPLLASLREPFLAWIHLYDPHGPCRPPPNLVPRTRRARATVDEYQSRMRPDVAFRFNEPAVAVLEHAIALYDGEVAHADAALGHLLAALRQRGVLERTIVVVTSDHGEGLFEHADIPEARAKNDARLYPDHGDHQYEEALRVPLVLAGPGIPKGRRAAGLVENVDVFPTLLAASGLPADPHASGRDLRELLDRGKPAVFAVGAAARSVRLDTGEKWIEPYPERAQSGAVPELFQLERDPRERANLAAAEPARARALAERLAQWIAAGRSALPEGDATSADLDDRLRELGYVK